MKVTAPDGKWAQERDELGNGVFTRALLDVLTGRVRSANSSMLWLNILEQLLNPPLCA
jgi:hypothetical protein